jgi:hypothetical protein
VLEVTASYKNAVAELNGGRAAPRGRVEDSDLELKIAGVRLAVIYEYGGRGLPEGWRKVWWQVRGGLNAAQFAMAKWTRP